MEPEDGLIAIGSGGPFAQSAAMALMAETDLDAESIVKRSLSIAGDICIYTNHNHIIETMEILVSMTPAQIVQELINIVGQSSAKRAVAIALRNRWRRMQLPAEMAQEITPKNILLIGPTAWVKPRSLDVSPG